MSDATTNETAGRAGILASALTARIAMAATILAAGFSAGYVASVGFEDPFATTAAALDTLTGPAPEAVAQAASPYFDLPSVVVNLRQTANARFIKLGLTLGIDPARSAEVERLAPHIVEALNLYLRELDEGDLAGSAGIHQLKSDLVRRIGLIDGAQAVHQIFIRELMIQ